MYHDHQKADEGRDALIHRCLQEFVSKDQESCSKDWQEELELVRDEVVPVYIYALRLDKVLWWSIGVCSCVCARACCAHVDLCVHVYNVKVYECEERCQL